MIPLFDFHTHVLPAMDDGSRTTAQSLAMLRAAASGGVRYVAATPHFYPHRENPDAFLARRETAWEALACAMAGEDGLPTVLLGAEVYAFEGMSECEELRRLTLAGGDALLVEMPMTMWSDRLLAELAGIQQKLGLIPIVAHIDRYLHRFNARRVMARMAELPVFLQANSSFFLDRNTRRMALHFLSDHRIHLIGSDCHDEKRRPPNLHEAAGVIAEKADSFWLSQLYQNSLELVPSK